MLVGFLPGPGPNAYDGEILIATRAGWRTDIDHELRRRYG